MRQKYTENIYISKNLIKSNGSAFYDILNIFKSIYLNLSK